MVSILGKLDEIVIREGDILGAAAPLWEESSNMVSGEETGGVHSFADGMHQANNVKPRDNVARGIVRIAHGANDTVSSADGGRLVLYYGSGLVRVTECEWL